MGTAIQCTEKEMEKNIIKERNNDTRFRGNLSEESQMLRNGIVNEDE